MLDRRLARVPQPVEELLQALSVLGSSAPLPLLSAMTDASSDELIERLEVARTAGIVETSATEVLRSLTCSIRDAVYEGIGVGSPDRAPRACRGHPRTRR